MQTIAFPKTTFKRTDTHPRPKDRQSAVDWAKRLMARRDWVILDTETTGIDKDAEIVQIGILSSTGKVLLETFVRPVRTDSIPLEAGEVHGITMDMLEDAPTIAQLVPHLREVLSGKTTIMYNAAFDTRLLRQVLEKDAGVGLDAIGLRPECAMKAYSSFVGEWMNSKGDYKWQKLPGAAHGAIEDCQATLYLIRQMANADNAREALSSGGNSEDLAIRLFTWAVILMSFIALVYVVLSQ